MTRITGREIVILFLILTVAVYCTWGLPAADGARGGEIKVASMKPARGTVLRSGMLLEGSLSYSIQGYTNDQVCEVWISVPFSGGRSMIAGKVPVKGPSGTTSYSLRLADLHMMNVPASGEYRVTLGLYRKQGSGYMLLDSMVLEYRAAAGKAVTETPVAGKTRLTARLSDGNRESRKIRSGEELRCSLSYELGNIESRDETRFSIYVKINNRRSVLRDIPLSVKKGTVDFTYSVPYDIYTHFSGNNSGNSISFFAELYTVSGPYKLTQEVLGSSNSLEYEYEMPSRESHGWMNYLENKSGSGLEFAQDMSLVTAGDTLYRCYSSMETIYFDRFTEKEWKAETLPAEVNRKKNNRPRLKYSSGKFYLSYLVPADLHTYRIMVRQGAAWKQVGRDITYYSKKWGILADSFFQDSDGTFYAAYSTEKNIFLMRLVNNSWRETARLNYGCVFLSLEKDEKGSIILAIGQPYGRPGARVMELDKGKFREYGSGITVKGYNSNFYFLKSGNTFYFGFLETAEGRQGITLFAYRSGKWELQGQRAFTLSGKGTDEIYLSLYRGSPVAVYRDSGYDSTPAVVYLKKEGWVLLGRAGFFPGNVSSLSLGEYKGKLLVHFYTGIEKSYRAMRYYDPGK